MAGLTAAVWLARAGVPVVEAWTLPRPGSGVEGRRLVAFAGIGDPGKFFATVREAGGEIAETRTFGDHHVYTDGDLSGLLEMADRAGADLVTTEKDAVRIRQTSPVAAQLLARLKVIAIDVEFEQAGAARRIVEATLAAFEK